MAAQLNNCDGTKILSRKLFKVAMAPEGLRREDAQRELVFPRSNEEAGKFYGETILDVYWHRSEHRVHL